MGAGNRPPLDFLLAELEASCLEEITKIPIR